MLYPENDPQGQLRAKAFGGQLEKAGWAIGDNLQIDYQWGTGDAAWVEPATERALQLSPDVLLANGDASVHSAMQLTKTIPVIFIGSGDPVEDGLVQSIAHPAATSPALR
jgi:putative ABC transport system substrate-binding protein